MKKNNLKFWQKFACHYTGFMKRYDILYHDICKLIREDLNSEMDVLELACGTGQISFALSPYVRNWEATDFSSAMVEEAKKQQYSQKLHFSIQDATTLPYGENSFDAVVISNALHIIPESEKVMSEIFRILKPGGLLFAPTFVWGKKRSIKAWIMEKFGFRIFHKWNAGEFITFVSQSGFNILKHDLFESLLCPLCYLKAQKPVEQQRHK